MTFHQIQEIIVPEIVGYITELTADDCYMDLCRIVLGLTGVNLCMVLYLTFRGTCSGIVVEEL